jgi:chemotaxis protein CheD
MLFCSDDAVEVTTILGSCIAVCLYDATCRVGGINHYMLPLWNGSGLETPKYGNIAIPKLIAMMNDIGSNTKSLKAKIFGGAKVLGTPESDSLAVGTRNTEIAQNTLREYGIPIIASSVGDTFGRKIIFNTATGEIKMKKVIRGGS